jgi:hypothetical protein
MKLGLERTSSRNWPSRVYHDIPADWLADGYKEILCLFSDWRERLQDDMALWTNPEWTRSVIRLQLNPREVLVHENVRHQTVLQASMGWKRRLSIIPGFSSFFSQFTSQSGKVDSSPAGNESRICSDAVLLVGIYIYVVVVRHRAKSFT